MKNVKKLMGLIISLTIILSLVVSSANAEQTTFSDYNSINAKDAVNYFVNNNVINGYSDGTFRPQGNLTRAEAAKIIATFKNGTSNKAVNFSDVNKDHWAFPYISYCLQEGYVSGYDGAYHPNDNLTGYQWAKIVLCSLDYDAKTNNLVGADWKNGVNELANNLSLFNNLTDNNLDNNITREDACQLLYNSLSVTNLGHYANSESEIKQVYNKYLESINNYEKEYNLMIKQFKTDIATNRAESDLMGRVPLTSMDIADAINSPNADFSYADEAESSAGITNKGMGITSETESRDYSKTNVQVEGIDEGDIVKNDGRYIYYLRSADSGYDLSIIDTKDNTSVIKNLNLKDEDISMTDLRNNKVEIDEDNFTFTYRDKIYTEETLRGTFKLFIEQKMPVEIYLGNNRLAIIYRTSHERNIVTLSDNEQDFDESSEVKDFTLVEIYDITNPSNIKLVNTARQQGILVDSRFKNNSIYLITTIGRGYSYYYYNSPIKSETDMIEIPSIEDNGTLRKIPVNKIYMTDTIPNSTINSMSYTVVSSYDINKTKFIDCEAILGDIDTVYMNNDSLYISREAKDYHVNKTTKDGIYDVTEYVDRGVTNVFKYSLTNGLRMVASINIPGYLDTQFSLDEYKGYLRAVTHLSDYSFTEYKDPEKGFTNYVQADNENNTNCVYVYDSEMHLVGSLTGLAKNEQVYSVRFDEDVVYFCTFRQTDPLFSVDLSNPKSPKVMGALKINGFSDYLHKWSDNLLLGFGKDATDSGVTKNIQLIMFDTSNKFDIKVKHKIEVPVTTSTALSNHRVMLIDSRKGLIGFPVSKGYLLYKYDKDGFKQIANVESSSYKDWLSKEARSVYIKDNVYILDCDFVETLDLNTYNIKSTIDYDNLAIK